MFVPKRPMRAHQSKVFEMSKDATAYGLLMRMRTGKSKVALDTGCYLFGKGKINSIVILAPKGVHSKWVLKDLLDDIPSYIDYRGAVWRSGNKKAIEECENLFTPGQFLRVVSVNIEALSRDNSDAEKYLYRFMNATDAMLIVDESHTIKNPDAKRTKRVLKLGNKAAYKRILTGTVTTGNIFDLYSQFSFLSEHIFGQSYYSFKHQYADILPDTHPNHYGDTRKGCKVYTDHCR